MNVLQNLTELYNHLSLDSTYREVARGILMNLDKLHGDFTIYDIAELTNSSRTTVWRMVQKMGYQNFTDFRHALKTATSQYNYYNRMSPDMTETDPGKIAEQACRQIHYAADNFLRECTPEIIRELAERIHTAQKIRFYFPFRIPMIYSLQQNLSMDGKDTAYFCLLPEMLADCGILNDKSLLFISCIEFAETMDMTEVFQKAREKGTYICLLGNERSRYRYLADQTLLREDPNVLNWLTSLEGLFFTVSEYYRGQYLSRSRNNR